MLRSELEAWLSACFAASSVDCLELPTSSMIFTTATVSSFACLWTSGGGVFYPESRAAAAQPPPTAQPSPGVAAADALEQRRALPAGCSAAPPAAGAGAVSARKRSIAAAIAAASSAEGAGVISSILRPAAVVRCAVPAHECTAQSNQRRQTASA